MQKLSGQGSNPWHSSDNAGTLTESPGNSQYYIIQYLYKIMLQCRSSCYFHFRNEETSSESFNAFSKEQQSWDLNPNMFHSKSWTPPIITKAPFHNLKMVDKYSGINIFFGQSQNQLLPHINSFNSIQWCDHTSF